MSTSITLPAPVEALVQAARKRRILAPATARRLGELAAGKGITELSSLRTWLDAGGDGVSADLARKLSGLLPPASLAPFGAYVPLVHLADGGMGSVWLAQGEGGLVVIKTIKAERAPQGDGSAATEFQRRFEREARITRSLLHPNVVQCLDSGCAADGTLFMILEYVDSGDLKDLVEMKGGLSEPLALALMHQVADGLAEAHRVHLVHRDIKPPNIFVAHDGRAKLADFGIARSTEATRTVLTMQGAIVGSPLYMAPEQIMSAPDLDIRADLYALGCVLHYCLLARPPYDGKLQEILHQHISGPVPDVRALRPALSEHSGRILARCMAKDRTARYASPAELCADLAAALGSLGVSPGSGHHQESTANGDLSGDGGAGFRRAGGNDATLAADLNAITDLPTRTLAEPEALRTMTANLLAHELELIERIGATAASVRDPATQATLVLGAHPGATQATMLAPTTSADRYEGDPLAAMSEPWIDLVPVAAGDPAHVVLVAKPMLLLGKLREAPVDLCLRNYPVAVHKDACTRISRQHASLRYDALAQMAMIEDLKSPNGSMLDGVTLTGGRPAPLPLDTDSILVVSGTVILWLRPFRRRGLVTAMLEGAAGQVPGDIQQSCGLERDHALDAVVITRPENRPEQAYAQVLRRLTIGGPGAELVLAGARTKAAVEVARYAGRWWWRVAGPGAWQPLAKGTVLDCGGRQLKAEAGSYERF